MTETFIGVRNVDEETFRKFKVAMLGNKMRLGSALTKAMETYMRQQEIQNKPLTRNLLNMKPVKIGRKVNWSKEVDETLYGK